jgi:hypothetical protein
VLGRAPARGALTTAVTGAALVIARVRAADLGVAAAVAAGRVRRRGRQRAADRARPGRAAARRGAGAAVGALERGAARPPRTLARRARLPGLALAHRRRRSGAWPRDRRGGRVPRRRAADRVGDRADLVARRVLLTVACSRTSGRRPPPQLGGGGRGAGARRRRPALGRHPPAMPPSSVRPAAGPPRAGWGPARGRRRLGDPRRLRARAHRGAGARRAARRRVTVGPVVGALLVWGPGTVWPLVPLVGTAPPLLVAGPLGLAVLAVRRGRPLLPAPVRRLAGDHLRRRSAVAGGPRSGLVVRGLPTPTGPLDLRGDPGGDRGARRSRTEPASRPCWRPSRVSSPTAGGVTGWGTGRHPAARRAQRSRASLGPGSGRRPSPRRGRAPAR